MDGGHIEFGGHDEFLGLKLISPLCALVSCNLLTDIVKGKEI